MSKIDASFICWNITCLRIVFDTPLTIAQQTVNFLDSTSPLPLLSLLKKWPIVKVNPSTGDLWKQSRHIKLSKRF